MRYRFKATTTVTQNIGRTLKTMFESMFSQMPQTKSKFCNIFDYFGIVTVVIRIWRWSCELKDNSFKCRNILNSLEGTI